jgi:hypothetical protein
MTVDIHFFSGYPVFGLGEEMDRDSQNLSKTVVEDIPQKVLDRGNHSSWLALPTPKSFFSIVTSPKHPRPDIIVLQWRPAVDGGQGDDDRSKESEAANLTLLARPSMRSLPLV